MRLVFVHVRLACIDWFDFYNLQPKPEALGIGIMNGTWKYWGVNPPLLVWAGFIALALARPVMHDCHLSVGRACVPQPCMTLPRTSVRARSAAMFNTKSQIACPSNALSSNIIQGRRRYNYKRISHCLSNSCKDCFLISMLMIQML